MDRSKAILTWAVLVVALTVVQAAHTESINASGRTANATRPFIAKVVATFNTPWAIAFLPDGRMLVTERPGHIFLVTQDGGKTHVGNVPAVAASGQNGLLHIATAPDFASSSRIYFSYVEPSDAGGVLALARATLSLSDTGPMLVDRAVIWRQTPKGGGGQPGGIIAFDPQGSHLFLTVGDRMIPASAQDPDQARGKLLRLNLDGSTPHDNPLATERGVRAQTWTTGHRNP